MSASSEHVLRVAVVGHTAQLSGAELALVRLLAALDPARVQPVVVLFAPGPLVERLDGTEVYVLPLDPRVATAARGNLGGRSALTRAVPTARFTLRLARLLRTLDVDVVHCNSLKADLIGGVAGRLARRPVVWYVHDRIAPDYLPRPVAALVRAAARLLPREVIANSAATLRTVRRRGGAVAYPGLAPHEFADDLPAEPERPVVGIVGRISPTKGQDVFLRAAAAVLRERPDTEFVVIGEALFSEQSYAERVRTLPAELGIADRVRFTGHVSDVRAALAGLSVLVHASPVPEPFGQVIVEAMAAGVPVIATHGGGVGEIVADDLARCVPPSAVDELALAIKEILADPGSARQRAARAQESVRARFTSAQTAQVVTQVWERAAAATGH